MAAQRPDDRPARLTPEAVARTTFPTSFRGYDPEHVRRLLDQIAGELRDARDREATLRAELEAVEARAEEMNRLDEARVTELLGEEMARVLTTAREAATEIKSKAEESVARLLRQAQDDADRKRAEADEILAQASSNAEAAAAEAVTAAERRAADLVAEAEARSSELVAEARQAVAEANDEADRIRAEAEAQREADLDAARAEGREMVNEALAARSRVLGDLSRKRKAARAQVERLQAGRERLLESYAVVRRTLEEATEELRTSLVEAKVAADAAARRVESEPETSEESLVAEIESARDVVVPAPVSEPARVPEPRPEVERGEGSAADEPQSSGTAAEPHTEPVVVDDVDDGPATIRVGKKKRGRRRDTDLPETELPTLKPPAEFEGVRIVSSEPEPEPEPAPAPESEPAPQSEPAAELAAEPDAADDAVDVDDLFARLRADRASEAARAKELLEEPEQVPQVAEQSAGDEPESTEAGAAPTSEPPEALGETIDADADEEVDEEENTLDRRDAILDAIEKQVARKLKRVVADEENDVLDRLRRAGKDAAFPGLYPALDDHLERYQSAVLADVFAAADAGATFFGGPGADTDVKDVADEMATSLVEPLRERVESVLRDAGDDEDARADGVRAAYRDLRTQRIGERAADTTHAAFNRGLFAALPHDGSARWLVDNGGTPCPDADDNALAGAVLRGKAFPTGHCYPPAHPGCRCMLVPVDAESDE